MSIMTDWSDSESIKLYICTSQGYCIHIVKCKILAHVAFTKYASHGNLYVQYVHQYDCSNLLAMYVRMYIRNIVAKLLQEATNRDLWLL